MSGKDSGWLIIAVGNPWRSDDGVAAEVLRLLAKSLDHKSDPDVQLRTASGEGTELMRLWQDHSQVILIDAASSGSEPGTVHHFDAAEQILPAVFHYSSHAFGLAEAVEMARALDRLPNQLLVFGIEGQEFGAGKRLTAPAAAAARRVAQEILGRVANSRA